MFSSLFVGLDAFCVAGVSAMLTPIQDAISHHNHRQRGMLARHTEYCLLPVLQIDEEIMRAGLRDMDRGELRPCERAGTFQSFPRDPRPCVCLSSCHASWCSPPTVVPSACMRRRRSYSFLASRMKSGLNDRRRLAAYSLGVNPRPVGAAGLPGMFGMVSFIAGTFLFAAGGVEHGPPVVARRPKELFPHLVDQLWEPLAPQRLSIWNQSEPPHRIAAYLDRHSAAPSDGATLPVGQAARPVGQFARGGRFELPACGFGDRRSTN